MNVLLAGAGVTARFRVAARADEGNAQRDESIAQSGWLARGQDQAGIGEKQAKRAHEPNQFPILDRGQGFEFAGTWAKTRQRNGQLRLPAMAQQEFGMS